MGEQFFGGPLHGQRRVVERNSSTFVMPLTQPAASFYAPDSGADRVGDDEVVYTRRRAPFSTARVWVAPDFTYDGPEWLAFDTEKWVRHLHPEVAEWKHLGEWFWRGQDGKLLLSRDQWLYVLGDRQGRGYVSHFVDIDVPADFVDEVHRHLQGEIDYHLLPECVVPHCGEKAPVAYRVAEIRGGRLAGRDWARDDEIRLCPEHDYDVRRAQGAYGIEQLADWIKPDAMLDFLDAYDAGTDLLHGREIEHSRSRMLRLDAVKEKQ
jgi:hypothetical protein